MLSCCSFPLTGSFDVFPVPCIKSFSCTGIGILYYSMIMAGVHLWYTGADTDSGFNGAEKDGDPDEFLPLPISEQYQLPSKRRRRPDQARAALPAQNLPRPGRAGFAAAQQAALRQAGLVSESDGEGHPEDRHPNIQDPRQTGQSAQDSRSSQAIKRMSTSGLAQHDTADEQAAEQRPLGPVFPRKHEAGKAKKPSKPASSLPAQPSRAFDFAAAKATAKGLDVSAMMSQPGVSKRNRERKGGDSARAGRGNDRAEQGSAGVCCLPAQRNMRGAALCSVFRAWIAPACLLQDDLLDTRMTEYCCKGLACLS